MLRLVVIMAKSVAQKREFGQGLKEQSRCEKFKEKDKIRNRKKRTALKIIYNRIKHFRAENREYKRAQRLRDILRKLRNVGLD